MFNEINNVKNYKKGEEMEQTSRESFGCPAIIPSWVHKDGRQALEMSRQAGILASANKLFSLSGKTVVVGTTVAAIGVVTSSYSDPIAAITHGAATALIMGGLGLVGYGAKIAYDGIKLLKNE